MKHLGNANSGGTRISKYTAITQKHTHKILEHHKTHTETYLGKLQESGCQEYLRYCLSGRQYLMQSNSGSIKGQLED